MIGQFFTRAVVGAGALIVATAFFASHDIVAQDQGPIIIAHRGASGFLPEHTLAAYLLGIQQGADYIEPDLVMTKDGHLVARHDIYLSTTTDVATRPEFANRKRVLADHDDWFVFDFTLAELKTLWAKQPFQGRSNGHDGLHEVATLQEVIELVQNAGSAQGVGLYIEMKRPALFEQQVDANLVSTVAAQLNAILQAGIPLYFQCFDIEFLRKLRPLTSAQLVYLEAGEPDQDTKHYTLKEDLTEYYDFIDGFGLFKALLVDADGNPTGIAESLKLAGKELHVWTARDDALPPGFLSGAQEIQWLLDLGVNGVFTDFPSTGVKVVHERSERERED